MAETLPAQIGRYEVLAELGQGAMGVVYKARDPQLARTVAIKTLRRDLGLPPKDYTDLRKRFYQEATAAGRLNHPNIVTIYDVVEIGDTPYIVMECLEGRSLAELIGAEGPLPPARAVALAVSICAALQYAHAHGVIHRDIKPGNIMVLAEDLVKVSDFGIARVAGSSVTRTGAVVGTPAYMSPEQLRGRPPDGRSDLFSLGVVLYEALTKGNPFQCDELTATLYQVVQVDPPPVRAKNPAVSVALERVTARALAKEPDQRYPTADALAQALRETVSGPAGAPAPAASTDGLPRPGRRTWLPRAAAVGAGCLVLAGVGWVVGGRGAPDSALQPAGRAAARSVVRSGEIVLSTNPAVEVLLDGAPKGRTGDGPLVIKDVAAGERQLVLRLGSRQQELSGIVREGQTLWLTYRFPEEARDLPFDKLFEATKDKILGTAKEKLRDLTGQRPAGPPRKPPASEH